MYIAEERWKKEGKGESLKKSKVQLQFKGTFENTTKQGASAVENTKVPSNTPKKRWSLYGAVFLEQCLYRAVSS